MSVKSWLRTKLAAAYFNNLFALITNPGFIVNGLGPRSWLSLGYLLTLFRTSLFTCRAQLHFAQLLRRSSSPAEMRLTFCVLYDNTLKYSPILGAHRRSPKGSTSTAAGAASSGNPCQQIPCHQHTHTLSYSLIVSTHLYTRSRTQHLTRMVHALKHDLAIRPVVPLL